MRLAPLVLVALAPVAACFHESVTAPPTVPAPKIRGTSQPLIAGTSHALFLIEGQVVTADSLGAMDIEPVEIIAGAAAVPLYADTKCPPIRIRVIKRPTAAPEKR